MNPNLDEARRLFAEGAGHFDAGRLEPARAAFAAALALAPGRPSIVGNLGITLFHLGRPGDALPLLRQATAADPANADTWTCLGLAEEAQGNWEEAIDALDSAGRLAPQKPGPWFRKGQCLMQLDRHTEALRAFDQALAADPGFADAWSARGSVLRDLDRLDEAAACFEKALALGGDSELNAYYLASVKGSGTPPSPPRRYVEKLFDDYAPQFQEHVVGQLRYQGVEVLLKPLLESGRRFSLAIDLGCGTGLCAQQLQPVTDVIDGVDLSQAMLDEARKLDLYRKLVHADVAEFLANAEAGADLIVAADVFIYVGDLDAVFAAARRVLVTGGRFAFTVELPSDEKELQLLPSLRYAHSETYVRRLAERHGFRVDELFRAPLRFDQARPLEGLYVYLS